MPDTCRSCAYRTVDFGGCRCQAFHVTGHLEVVDPVCRWSPDHHLIQTARHAAEQRTERVPLWRRDLQMVP